MTHSIFSPRHGQFPALLAAVVLSLVVATPTTFATDLLNPEAGFVLVPEMETPGGIEYQPAHERKNLPREAIVNRGLELLESRVKTLWPQIRAIDIVELSRWQKEATEGYSLPAECGKLTGQAVAYDESSGHLFLELRGPRLPARYDIVHRHLYIYARFDPRSNTIDRLTVTIRGWVLE